MNDISLLTVIGFILLGAYILAGVVCGAALGLNYLYLRATRQECPDWTRTLRIGWHMTFLSTAVLLNPSHAWLTFLAKAAIFAAFGVWIAATRRALNEQITP